MKTTTTVLAALALSLAASGAALAQEATYEYPQPIVAAKSRDQVKAELLAARADGSIKVWASDYNMLGRAKSEKSREEVRAERASAYVAALTGEDGGSFALQRAPRGRDTAPVLALRAQ